MKHLYPPIVDTYMPAVTQDMIDSGMAQFHFKLSNLNTIDEINKNIILIIKDPNTNKSIFATQQKPDGIVTSLCKGEDGDYYIQLNTNNYQFKANTYYKIQIKFVDAEIQSIPTEPDTKWMLENANYISDWSSICLLKVLQEVNFTMPPTLIHLNKYIPSDITFSLIFGENDNEQLKTYRIKLSTSSSTMLNDINKNIVYDTGDMVANSPMITHYFPYLITEDVTYILLELVSTNGFITDAMLNVVMDNTATETNLLAEANPDDANIKVKLTTAGNIYRASSVDGFKKWSLMAVVSQIDKDGYWIDNTVESEVWYKYICGHSISEPVMCSFDFITLTSDGTTVKIPYNASISSYQIIRSESKIETIGSQYPFVRRNGNMNYHQLQVSGLITYLMDQDFYSPQKAFGENYNLYESYSNDNHINHTNNYMFDRMYREKLLTFLTDGKVKLLRSLTEGNFLVRLMNPNLSGMSQLSNLLYNFTTDAIEITECTPENFKKFNIQPFEAKLISVNELPPTIIEDSIERTDGGVSL